MQDDNALLAGCHTAVDAVGAVHSVHLGSETEAVSVSCPNPARVPPHPAPGGRLLSPVRLASLRSLAGVAPHSTAGVAVLPPGGRSRAAPEERIRFPMFHTLPPKPR